MTQFPSVSYILPEYFSVPGPRLLPIFLPLLFNLDKKCLSHWVPKALFLATTYLTPSPRPGLAPFLPLLQGYRATLAGWLAATCPSSLLPPLPQPAQPT